MNGQLLFRHLEYLVNDLLSEEGSLEFEPLHLTYSHFYYASSFSSWILSKSISMLSLNRYNPILKISNLYLLYPNVLECLPTSVPIISPVGDTYSRLRELVSKYFGYEGLMNYPSTTNWWRHGRL